MRDEPTAESISAQIDDVGAGIARLQAENERLKLERDEATIWKDYAEAERDIARTALDKACELIIKALDGGMTDYSEAPNEPVCGYCGYEVTTCNAKLWDDDGFPYTEDNPCPGIEARDFIARRALTSTTPPAAEYHSTGGNPPPEVMAAVQAEYLRRFPEPAAAPPVALRPAREVARETMRRWNKADEPGVSMETMIRQAIEDDRKTRQPRGEKL